MANIKTVQERNELHKAIWNIANDLRGSVDGWDFKQYVLGMLFYRYISERIKINGTIVHDAFQHYNCKENHKKDINRCMHL